MLMKILIIGRSEALFDTMSLLKEKGHVIQGIITSKEAPEYTKTSEDFKEYADIHQIPYLYSPKLGSAENLEFINSCGKIDIGVSFNYTGIIPESVISLTDLGILNAHGGDLPRYRGNACQAWAIINGEESIGLCVHKMNPSELDSGDILSREHMGIDINTKVTECWKWMQQRVPELFAQALDKLQLDRGFVLEVQSKNPEDALRCYPRIPSDGKILWTKAAGDILRLINASNKPYAGAFCHYKGKKLIIWDAELDDCEENYLAVTGQVCIQTNKVSVITGNGKLKLNTVEYEQTLHDAVDFFKSIRLRLE